MPRNFQSLTRYVRSLIRAHDRLALTVLDGYQPTPAESAEWTDLRKLARSRLPRHDWRRESSRYMLAA